MAAKVKIKNLITKLANFINKYHWRIIIIQVVLCVGILKSTSLLKLGFFNDQPGYLLFDFSSLRTILGEYRTFGLPLLLKLYSIIFKGYEHRFYLWPWVQMFFYFFSVFFLYWAMLKFGFNRILSLIIASHLIWENSVHANLKFIMTEPWAASFLNLTIGCLLLTFRQRSWKTYLALGFSTFFLYQIRPNCVFVPILLPFWAVIISLMFERFNFIKVKNIFILYAAIALIPLFLFCWLRLFVVGQFGLSAFGGTTLSMQATYYLNEDNIKRLSGESRIIAEKILAHKRKFRPLPEPKLSPSINREQKYLMQKVSQPSDCMISWLAAIKYMTGKEPFDDPVKNIDPWNHINTLATFFTIYNVDIDKLLMKYSKDVLMLEWRQCLPWIAEKTFFGMGQFIKDIRSTRRAWIIFLVTMLLIIRPIFFWCNYRAKIKSEIKQWYRQLYLVTILALSIFLFGGIFISIFVSLESRYLELFSLYLFPTITLWAFPPFIVEK